jgi:hypothetical protein
MLPRTLPAGFVPPCLPSKTDKLPSGRDFYSKKASTLEEENRQLTECAIKYSEHAQKPELRAQKLERELNRIDPDGAPGRRFDAEETT